MIHFSALIVLTCALASFATPLEKRTVAQVEADVAAITTQVKNLDAAIDDFPNTGGSLAAALAVHTGATNLETAINRGTTDIQNTGTVSEADGNTILQLLQAIVPAITDALQQIAEKRPAFDALPISGVSTIIKQDLATLNTDISAFDAALTAAVPADLKPVASAMETDCRVGFAAAIAAYASA